MMINEPTIDVSYSPVQYVYREIIEEEIQKKTEGKVFFFEPGGQVNSAEGKLLTLEDVPGQGLFIALEPAQSIRIDRIITLFGKPGAAFDEYDSYGNQCLSCTGRIRPLIALN